VAVPIIFYIILQEYSYLFFALVAVGAFLAMLEFLALARKGGMKTYVVPSSIGFVFVGAGFLAEDMQLVVFGILAALFASVMKKLFDEEPLENSFNDMTGSVIGLLYVPVPMFFLYYIWLVDCKWIFFLLVVIWASDTFAYYVGCRYGKRRLYELISPKKSIEGALAAYGGGIICGTLFMVFFLNGGIFHGVLASFVLVTVGVLGDLAESMLKRNAGVKDSGNLLPGHGGFLDRLDSTIFAAPALFFYIEYLVG